MSASESNPTNFNCDAKEDIANKPYKIGDDTNYFEDPVICSGFIDVQGIPSRPTDIEITNGDVRIYTGNLLVRPGISTFQEVQIEKELYVCNDTDLMSNLHVEGTSHLEGNVTTGGDMSIGGYASWSGSIVATSKLFDIVHPVKGGTNRLAHSCIESPKADLIYRGKTALVAGIATVEINTTNEMSAGTFEALVDNVQCFTTNETGWTAIKGSVTGGSLTIQAKTASCTDTISWMVVGERKDIKSITVEYQGDKTESPNRDLSI